MGLIEQVGQMRQQGKSEEEIINTMQQQGNSPAQIKNALDQSNVKNAISSGGDDVGVGNDIGAPSPGQDQAQDTYNPQPQTQEAYNPQPQQQAYSPQPQQQYDQGGYDQSYDQGGYDQSYDQSYDQGGYDQGGYGGGYQQGGGSNFMMDIAEQVFSENIKELQSNVEKLQQISDLTKNKVDNMEQRLKRMEKMFDTLQIKILEKVGSYGADLRSARKEMQMLEDSFSKVAQPLLDKSKDVKKASKKK